MFRTQSKSITPRSFHICPTLINYNETSSNNQSGINNELMTGWSARINPISALFYMMSSNTIIDHPLCEECADQLINQLDAQCKMVEREHMGYSNLLNKTNQQVSNNQELENLRSEIEVL